MLEMLLRPEEKVATGCTSENPEKMLIYIYFSVISSHVSVPPQCQLFLILTEIGPLIPRPLNKHDKENFGNIHCLYNRNKWDEDLKILIPHSLGKKQLHFSPQVPTQIHKDKKINPANSQSLRRKRH